jgi:hypothetical protein
MVQGLPALAGFVFLCSGVAVEAAASSKATAPASDSFDFRYSVSLLGLPIGTARISGTLGSSGYRFEGTGRLTGLAGVIVNTKGAASATGALAAGRLVPATFAASAANSNTTLTIRMAMANGDVKAVQIMPPYEERPDRIPLTDANRRGIIDPMSSFIMPVPGGGDPIGPAACERTLPLYEGGVRFDVSFHYEGRREVAGPAYTGPVAVCSVRYKPIAGYRPDRPVTKFMAANKDMEVWLAPLGKSRFVVPYHISVLGMVGTVLIEATQFSVASAGKTAAVPASAGTAPAAGAAAAVPDQKPPAQ